MSNYQFLLFQLAWQSDVQDKLRDEINKMITDTNDDYNIENVENIKYLDMVVSGMFYNYY